MDEFSYSRGSNISGENSSGSWSLLWISHKMEFCLKRQDKAAALEDLEAGTKAGITCLK